MPSPSKEGFRMIEHSAHSRVAGRFLRYLVLLLAFLVATPVFAASAEPAAQQAAARQDSTLKILLFYKPQFHASHVQARMAIRDMATQLGQEYGRSVEITETDNAAVFTPENLATYDTLAFAQTGGVLFNDEQRAALQGYIRGGGGWLGLHYTGWTAGAVSEHDVNDWYLRLVGAVSEHHPENPAVKPATVRVSEPDHPLTAGVPASFTRSDEWYDWNVNPAANVRTLLEADESTYTDGRQGTKHPITWCQNFEGGRSWYTSMGHEGAHWSEPVIRTQLRNGLAYTAGLLPADCSPPVKDKVGAWSPVTPWPLMAINTALTPDGQVYSFGSTQTGGSDSTPYDWTGNSAVAQGGQYEIDIWDPKTSRTLDNLDDGVLPNTTYTDMFCSIQVYNPNRRAVMTMGGDDGLGVNNDPVNGPVGVTSYATQGGLRDEAPMRYPRWYPTANVMPNGDIVVQGGSVRGVSGPGVLTPERYTPDEGSGWTPLTGARSAEAYGNTQNRWWYPRSWVAPENGNLFTISGSQVSELDPAGTGTLTLRGTLPPELANQGALGQPIGATSTAVMYAPGKILQVGGGAFSNGGGGDGARGGFTVDITGAGGTANPVYAATQPMRFGRHWANATVLPTGEVLVTGGGRSNNGAAGVVTTPEIWNPDTGEWTSDLVPYAHARLYHSTGMLLPDGRVMIAGGGGPGPRNYTDAEFYSPPYLFDGNELAARPKILNAPSKIGYDGQFTIQASEAIDRVTLVRFGSVTHSWNNGQTFQDLEFRQAGANLTVEAPANGTYAPPGSYMLFALNADGTPSQAALLEIDPEVAMDSSSPLLVDQFEYPRVPAEWTTANPPTTVTVEPGSRRMAPWTINGPVQLSGGRAPTMGGLGVVGYQLNLGANGRLERPVKDLIPGQEYRISLRYARDSGVAVGAGDTVSADLSIGSLDTTITATADEPSRHPTAPTEVTFATYAGTFTATQRTETLTLAASGTSAGVVIDDLVIHAPDGAPLPPDPQPRIPTTTTVSVDPASPVPWGAPLTVSAAVEGATGEPAEGVVELWIDGTRQGGVPGWFELDGDGKFTFPQTRLDEGEHTVEVRFVGNAGWRESRASVTSVIQPPPPIGDRPVQYTFDEGQGTTAANTGTDVTIGNATLNGGVGWTPDGRSGSAVDLPGGAPNSNNYVSLPNNLTAREEYKDDEFSVSLWARPRALTNWVPLIQIGSGTNTFFLVQSNMQEAGCRCFGFTLKAPASGQERLLLGQGRDLPLNQWTHVVVTMSGSTGKIYLNGELQATRTNFPIGIGDVGIDGTTTANQLGSTSWFDQKWNGSFDDVRIYADELGQEEIRELFEGGATPSSGTAGAG
jgi:type 1 glutamine amidotransferase